MTGDAVVLLMCVSLLVLLGISMRAQFGFALVIMVQLAFRIVGVLELSEPNEAWVALALLGAASAFLLGYWPAARREQRRRPSAVGITATLSNGFVWATVIAAGVLGVYHLLASGIPLFSDSIETERFSFTSSGLWGIPGRMYLFGIPISWLVALTNGSAREGRIWSYKPLQLATGFLVLTSLLGGFKGDMISLAVFVFASLNALKAKHWAVWKVLARSGVQQSGVRVPVSVSLRNG